jgi:hypothetical protein
LKQIESLSLELYLGSLYSLILGFSKSEALLLALFFGPKPIDFPSNTGAHLGLASICHYFALGPSSKGLGTNLKLLTNKIA